MHVLLVCTARGIPLYGPSGASAHLRGVASALKRAGHRVTVLIAGDTNRHRDPLDVDVVDVPAPVWPRSRRRREGLERAHSRTLMDAAPKDVDLVWERHGAPSDGPMRWCAKHGVPRWLEINAPITLERRHTDPFSCPRWTHRLEARSVSTADRCLVVSQWLIPWAQALGARQVTFLPNGTDTKFLEDRHALRTKLGLTGTVLGFIGSGKPWHQLDRLPALLDALPHTQALVLSPSAPPHSRLVALDSAPSSTIAAMDVGLVLGGLPWVNPLKIWDYRAHGTPIVSVPLPDAAFAIGDGGRVAPWGPDFIKGVQWASTATVPAHRRSWDDVVREAFSALP